MRYEEERISNQRSAAWIGPADGRCGGVQRRGGFCATQARCTHRQGPLSEGTFDGSTVTCPLHGSQFNVRTGAVLRGPAKDPLKTYRVTVDGEVGRVDVPLALLSKASDV